ncbi:MAG: DUF4224 domain-containing protein [Burkholderiaceae bacterium]|jgi:hypothetical protein|nr:DUF4224 domain-containing protein [Burkholderiaceae bacterium]
MNERPFFLTDAELRTLTGWSMKSKQAQWLKAQAIPFRVNATGHPVVTRSTIEGREQQPLRRAWEPSLAGA